MRKIGLTLVSILVLSLAGPASAGILAHAAGYAIGGVAAHETERYIDHRKTSGFNNDTSSNGGGNPMPVSSAVPNPSLTPGAINLNVTQQNIYSTICRAGGYTKSIRPAESYTFKLKRQGIRDYGFVGHKLSEFEEDHLVSLEIGGAPYDPRNLWPEPHNIVGGWGSYTKDQLENKLHDMVCAGQISLANAQHQEATDWIGAYRRYVSSTPVNSSQGW